MSTGIVLQTATVLLPRKPLLLCLLLLSCRRSRHFAAAPATPVRQGLQSPALTAPLAAYTLALVQQLSDSRRLDKGQQAQSLGKAVTLYKLMREVSTKQTVLIRKFLRCPASL